MFVSECVLLENVGGPPFLRVSTLLELLLNCEPLLLPIQIDSNDR